MLMDPSFALIKASIEEVMVVLTSTILGATPRSLLSYVSAPLKLPYLLAHTSNWGVLEHSQI